MWIFHTPATEGKVMHDYDQLSPEARHSYEALPLPFAIVRLCGSQSVLFSEGLCRLLHADRKTLTAALSNGFTGILHPDDRDKLRMAVSDACLRPDGDFKGTGRFAANGKATKPGMRVIDPAAAAMIRPSTPDSLPRI